MIRPITVYLLHYTEYIYTVRTSKHHARLKRAQVDFKTEKLKRVYRGELLHYDIKSTCQILKCIWTTPPLLPVLNKCILPPADRQQSQGRVPTVGALAQKSDDFRSVNHRLIIRSDAWRQHQVSIFACSDVRPLWRVRRVMLLKKRIALDRLWWHTLQAISILLRQIRKNRLLSL